MGTLWVMVIVIILANGDVKTELQWPLKPEYNTEASCSSNADKAATALQVQLGSNNARVLWQCQGVKLDELAKTLGKPGVDL